MVEFAQAITQLGKQRVVCGIGQIIDVYFVRVSLTTRSAHGDVHNVGVFCPLSQGSFCFDLITCIDEGIHRAERKQTWPVVCIHKFVHTLHNTIRMKLGNTVPLIPHPSSLSHFMNPIAIFRHVSTEGPGYLAEFLDARNIPWQLIAIDAGDAVPACWQTMPDWCSWAGR